jgi:hypothetical protein
MVTRKRIGRYSTRDIQTGGVKLPNNIQPNRILAGNQDADDAIKQPEKPSISQRLASSVSNVQEKIKDAYNETDYDPGNKLLSRLEANADKNDGNSTALADSEMNDDEDDDSFYKNDSAKKSKGIARIFKSKKAMFSIFGSGGVLAVIAIIGSIVFPSFMMNHMSDMIIDSPVSELTSQHMIRYRRTKISRMSDLFSKDGRRGGRIIAEMERKGYIFSFDPADKNKIVGIRRLGSNASTPNINGAVDETIRDFLDKEHSLRARSAKWKSGIMDSFYDRYKVSRKSVVASSADDLENPKNTINRNLFRNVQGESADVDVETRIADGADEAEQERMNRLRQIADGDTELFEADRKLISETGADIQELSPVGRAASQFAEGAGPDVGDILDEGLRSSSKLGKLASGLKGMLDVTDIPDSLCTLNRRLRAVTAIARTATSLELIRYGYAFVSADDAQRKQEAAEKLVAALVARAMIPDDLGSYFGDSTGYSYATKGTFSLSANELYKSPVSVGGRLGGVYKKFQEASAIPGCAVWTNPVARVGINIGIAVISVVTGGGATVASQTFGQTVRFAVTNAIKQMFTKRGLAQFGLGLAGGFTIEGIALMVQIYAQRTLDFNFTTQEQGALLSSILGASSGVINKQRALQAGFVPATAEEYAKAYDEYLAVKDEELSQKSSFARIFDIRDKDSLAYEGVASLALDYGNVSNATRNLSVTIANAPTNIASVLTSFLNPIASKAKAQSSDEVYFDTYTTVGDNPVTLATGPADELIPIMRNDIESIDPVENEAYLLSTADGGPHIDATTKLPSSTLFTKHVENCVESPDTLTLIEENSKPDDPTKDCLANLILTKRFKAHLAWLDMQSTLDGSLFPNEVSEVSSPTQVTGGDAPELTAAGLNGFTIPCEGEPRQVIRVGTDSADWSSIPDSGTIGTNSAGNPIKVYVRNACAGVSDVKTVVIVGSIHGSENGGQLVAHELLFNADIPENVRIVAIPEYCSCAGTNRRGNENGVDLNRNNAYEWSTLPQTQTFDSGLTWSKGSSAGSEPETKAVNNFLTSLGRASVSIHYHDSLNYVAPVGSTNVLLARQYADATSMTVGNENSTIVTQRGSIDAWYNKEFGTPAILVEMGSSQTDAVIERHVRGVQAILTGGLL